MLSYSEYQPASHEISAEISVIVPVYNSASCLGTTINCLRRQTCDNIEILLIDDGSADESAQICRSASERIRESAFFSWKPTAAFPPPEMWGCGKRRETTFPLWMRTTASSPIIDGVSSEAPSGNGSLRFYLRNLHGLPRWEDRSGRIPEAISDGWPQRHR